VLVGLEHEPDSLEALERYQDAKRAHKAKLRAQQ